MLGGRLKILQDTHEALGKVSFRWDRAPQKRPGRQRSCARQRVAVPPKRDSLAHRQGRASLPSALLAPAPPLAHGVDALLDE
jgi:hypothetical protein